MTTWSHGQDEPGLLVVPEHRVRPVGLLETLPLGVVELQAQRGAGVLEMRQLRRADDRRRRPGLGEEPGEGHLGRLDAAAPGDLDHPGSRRRSRSPRSTSSARSRRRSSARSRRRVALAALPVTGVAQALTE